jgi:hypothetical protein
MYTWARGNGKDHGVKDDDAVQRQARTPRRWVPQPNGMENPIMRNLKGGLLHFFTKKSRGFHDLLNRSHLPCSCC